MDLLFENSEDNNSGNIIEQDVESDWYRESDTGDEIPDPNMQKEPLYQKSGKLPCRVRVSHFEEGLIYTMTFLKEKLKPMLAMITAKRTHDFSYRVFFVRGSSRKTYHQAGTDRKAKYDDVWRLAPRKELIFPQEVSNVFIGQTLRFTYGMNDTWETILVLEKTSSTVTGVVQCGHKQGTTETYDKIEMINCQEIFGSPILHKLFAKIKSLEWEIDNKCKTRKIPNRRPTLNRSFMVPNDESYKRKWHVMKIIGKAEELLCKRTNMRARRKLRKCNNDAYKALWRDLEPGPIFSTFFGVYLGVSFLGVGERHLEKLNPSWITQKGEGRLFGKIPGGLFRILNAHFVAHAHRDTILFKRSIREQRIRFYGVKRLSEIIYQNSRKSREPPNTISGDETVIRCYTKKATDVRMRTSKKNESGILCQGLCSSNEGYATYKEGDPKASGFTFACMSYPGAGYNVGSMFREKDMGNLLQLVFSCREYFRFKDIELVTDSHFGHIVPIVYTRFWKLFVTSSFSVSQRLGVSSIEELSKKKLGSSERQALVAKLQEEKESENIMLDEDSDVDISDYGEEAGVKKKTFRGLKTKQHFFEHDLTKKE